MSKSSGIAVACGYVLCGGWVGVNYQLLWNCGCLWACTLRRGVDVNYQLVWNCGCLLACSLWRGLGVNDKSCGYLWLVGMLFVEGVGVNN